MCAHYLFSPLSVAQRVSIIIPLGINVWHAQVLVYEIEQGAHLALCGCNEHEQAVGSGVGVDQETSVSVFPLTASGPLWNQTQCGGRDPRPELRDALQVAGTGVNWKLAPATSAREALALTHWRPIVTYIDLNDSITNNK